MSFTEPNIQNVPKDFEIQMPTLIEESQPSQNSAQNAYISYMLKIIFIHFRGKQGSGIEKFRGVKSYCIIFKGGTDCEARNRDSCEIVCKA